MITFKALKRLLRELGVKIDTTSTDIARQSTLQSINSKITKCDTDNVTISGFSVAYDNFYKAVKTTLVRDNVGLAKDSTLQETNTKLDDIQTSISSMEDSIVDISDNVKGAWRLGVKDLTLATTDPKLAVPSDKEVDFNNMTLHNKYFNYGVTRCHGYCVVGRGGKLKLTSGSIFRFVR